MHRQTEAALQPLADQNIRRSKSYRIAQNFGSEKSDEI